MFLIASRKAVHRKDAENAKKDKIVNKLSLR